MFTREYLTQTLADNVDLNGLGVTTFGDAYVKAIAPARLAYRLAKQAADKAYILAEDVAHYANYKRLTPAREVFYAAISANPDAFETARVAFEEASRDDYAQLKVELDWADDLRKDAFASAQKAFQEAVIETLLTLS